MPNNYINKLSQKYNISVEKLEKHWKDSKDSVKNKENFGLIVKIFKSKINKYLGTNEFLKKEIRMNKYLVNAIVETVLNKEANDKEQKEIVEEVMDNFKVYEMDDKESVSNEVYKILKNSLFEENINTTANQSDSEGHDLCDDAALDENGFKNDPFIAQNHSGFELPVRFGNFEVIGGSLQEAMNQNKPVIVSENNEYYFVNNGISNKVKALDEHNVELEIVNERTFYILTKRNFKTMARFNETELKNIHEFAVSCGKNVIANYSGNKIKVQTR